MKNRDTTDENVRISRISGILGDSSILRIPKNAKFFLDEFAVVHKLLCSIYLGTGTNPSSTIMMYEHAFLRSLNKKVI